MIALAFYVLKVIACSGILFLYYQLFLRNKLFHQWNRFYLLFAVVLSLVLPLIKIDMSAPDSGSSAEVLKRLLLAQSSDRYLQEFVVYYNQGFTTQDWLVLAYVIVCFCFLFALAKSICKIIRIIRRHDVKVFENFRVLSTREPGTPFSFLQYIVWNEEISIQSEAGQKIFQHELVHVKEKHSWDKLFMQAVLLLFWCNPFFWLIRKELRFVHEFVADQKAVGNDADAFAAMILQTVYPSQFDAIRNPFFQSSIKRRLQMLTQLKNPKTAYISRLIALPLIALIAFAFTVRTKEVSSNNNFLKDEVIALKNINDTTPKKQISAVNVNKNQKEITIKYVDGSEETLTEKQATEKGLLNSKTTLREEKILSVHNKSTIRLNDIKNPPLFVLEGKIVTMEEIEKINPQQIKHVNVLKAEAGTALYGEKGSNGVVEIKLKAATNEEPVSIKENGEPILDAKIREVKVWKTDSINIIADEVTVVGKKIEKADKKNVESRKLPTDIVVEGTITDDKRNQPEEVTVTGRKFNNEPVFEKAEYAPSINFDDWRKFLETHTQPIVNELGGQLPAGKYTVMVRFIVEKDGSISGIRLLNDPGHGLGQKVLKMMEHAPRWKPAIQNQHVVRSYHTQPITFVIGETT